jgi:hypothetical protein
MRTLYWGGILVLGSVLLPACGGQSKQRRQDPSALEGGDGGSHSSGEAGLGGVLEVPDDAGGTGDAGGSSAARGDGGNGGLLSATGGVVNGGGTPSATGGSPSTGASSPAGGAPATGGVGQPGQPSRAGAPPIEECMPVETPLPGADHCVLGLQCPGINNIHTFCSDAGDGSWSCRCDGCGSDPEHQAGLA